MFYFLVTKDNQLIGPCNEEIFLDYRETKDFFAYAIRITRFHKLFE